MTTWLIGRKNSKKIVKVPLQCLLLNQLIAYRKLSDPPLLGHQIHKFTFSILGLQTGKGRKVSTSSFIDSLFLVGKRCIIGISCTKKQMIKNNEPFDIFIVSNLKGITLVRRGEDRLRRVTLVSASFERRILSCIHDKAFIPTNEIITKYNIFKKIKEKKA